jgi:hypothetical protein
VELRRKLTILADAAKYDASCASSGAKRAGTPGGLGHSTGEGICHSYTPDGRCVSLLKIPGLIAGAGARTGAMIRDDGQPAAPLMLVGEQPGDQEDLAGRPFVGPAGEVLDAALRVAGIDRASAYVTNAVKHFRFLPRGKKRLQLDNDLRAAAALVAPK